MKQQLKHIVVSLCMLGMTSIPIAVAANPSTDVNQQVETVSSRADALAKQVTQLQREVAILKGQRNRNSKIASRKNKAKVIVVKHVVHIHHGHPNVRLTHADFHPPQTATTMERHILRHLHPTAAQLENQQYERQQSVESYSVLPPTGTDYFPLDLDVPGQSFVSTGPYIGVPLQFSGGNLIINSPSINEDVALLNLRKNIRQRLRTMGIGFEENHAHLLLSGLIEAQANYKQNGSNKTDINVTRAALDAYILGPVSWTSGLISLHYDDNIGADDGSLATNYRVANSRVFVRQAFITLGDFEQTGLYSTLGQMFVPFGTYSSNMISSPLTQLLARTKARAVLIGYQQQAPNAFYVSGYVFKGDSHAGTKGINNGGINLGYRFERNIVKGNFGGGVIGNIADSSGMQVTGGRNATPPVFDGFGGINGLGNEQLVHRVPAYNLRGLFSIGAHIDLLAEYVGASTSFSRDDLTFNNSGARPWALNVEAAYSFCAFNRPSAIAIGYARAKDVLALGLPTQRYSLVFNTSWWKDTLQSLELRHDVNYGKSDFATGSDVVPFTHGPGRSDNMVTAQFDLYI